MGEAKLKLVGANASLFTLRVMWALKLKGLEFEFVVEDLRNKSQFLLSLNPVHKMVPVLVHAGKVIIESKIILEYIDEVWKGNHTPPLLPEDPHRRAYMRFWADFIDGKLSDSLRLAFMAGPKEKEAATKVASAEMQILEEEMKRNGIGGKNKFFGGDKVGYLDMVAGWLAHRLPVIEEIGGFNLNIEPVKFPCLTSWAASFVVAPEIKPTLPHPDEMRAIFLDLYGVGHAQY